MANIMVSRKTRTIEVTKKFNKASSRYGSDEYKELQNVLNDNPGFKVVVKSSTKKNDGYKGLTYKYMEKYISTHDDENNSIMTEYNMLRGIGEDAEDAIADSLTYAEMKDWFLDKFPAIAQFHKDREEIMKKVQENKVKKVAQLEREVKCYEKYFED